MDDKKLHTVEERKILIDVHEPEDIEREITKLGLFVERVPLECGDYVVGNIVIERKDINDYYMSLREGRLWEQLYKMLTSGRRCMLVVIGTFPYKLQSMKLTPKQLLQDFSIMKGRIFCSYGIYMEVFENQDSFIKYINNMWISYTTPSYAPSVPKADNPEESKRLMFSCLPGVGKKLSLFLAEHYSIRELLDMDEKVLSETVFSGRKIGVRAKKIKEVLNL